MSLRKEFKVGDEVITFEYVQKNKWTPATSILTTTSVLMVQDGKVWVDGMYGLAPYNPEDIEFADVPF